jgi:hypothetical protein
VLPQIVRPYFVRVLVGRN